MKTEFECTSVSDDTLTVELDTTSDEIVFEIDVISNWEAVYLSLDDAKELVETLQALIEQGEQA